MSKLLYASTYPIVIMLGQEKSWSARTFKGLAVKHGTI